MKHMGIYIGNIIPQAWYITQINIIIIKYLGKYKVKGKIGGDNKQQPTLSGGGISKPIDLGIVIVLILKLTKL